MGSQPAHSTGTGAGFLQSIDAEIADALDALIVQRAAALVEMRTAGDDLLRFKIASKREALLAAEIRHLRQGGAV